MAKASMDRKKKVLQLKHEHKEYVRVINLMARQKQELIDTINKLHDGVKYIRSQFQQWNNSYGYVQFRLKNYEVMEMAASQRPVEDRAHLPLANCMPRHSLFSGGSNLLLP